MMLKANFKLWIENNGVKTAFGAGKCELLKAIDKHGSLTAASAALGLSYRKAWKDLKSMEAVFGTPLVNKTRGGKEGGGATLTPAGRLVVEQFSTLYDKVTNTVKTEFQSINKNLEKLS